MDEPKGIIYQIFEGPAGDLLFVRWSRTATTVSEFDRERFQYHIGKHQPNEKGFFLLNLDPTVQAGGYHDLLFHDPDRIVGILIPEGADQVTVLGALEERFGTGTELREEPIHYMLTMERILALEALADHRTP